MKYYKMYNNNISEMNQKNNLTFIHKNESKIIKELNFINHHHLNELNLNSNNITIDFFKEYYFGNLNLPKDILNENINLFFIASNNDIIFVYDDKLNINRFVDLLNNEFQRYITMYNHPLFILVLITNILLRNDTLHANKLQKEIDRIENTILSDTANTNVNKKLLATRKQLNHLKKRNDSISDFIDILTIEESTNDIKQHLKLLNNKTQRAQRNLQNMIEHIIQIKEVFQNQLDISLNHSMNIFTVIAAIFLPLQLITGWYGMNFKMPEYKYELSYFILIIISIIIFIGLIYIIKKKNFLKK